LINGRLKIAVRKNTLQLSMITCLLIWQETIRYSKSNRTVVDKRLDLIMTNAISLTEKYCNYLNKTSDEFRKINHPRKNIVISVTCGL